MKRNFSICDGSSDMNGYRNQVGLDSFAGQNINLVESKQNCCLDVIQRWFDANEITYKSKATTDFKIKLYKDTEEAVKILEKMKTTYSEVADFSEYETLTDLENFFKNLDEKKSDILAHWVSENTDVIGVGAYPAWHALSEKIKKSVGSERFLSKLDERVLQIMDDAKKVITGEGFDNGLLPEIWEKIFLEGDFKDFPKMGMVDKELNKLVNSPALTKKMIFEQFCFNPSHWDVFCGKGTVSPDEMLKAFASLPPDILEILKSDCNAFAGKKVLETHMLVYIPETLKGKPITLDNFGLLLKEQPEFSGGAMRCNWHWALNITREGSTPVKSGWVLMLKDIIPGSLGRSYASQKSMVESLNKNGQTGYRFPKVAEAIISIMAEYLRSKKRLFGDAPLTYMRCGENFKDLVALLGGFAPSGLNIRNDIFGDDGIGVAGLRKF